jgi:hypothetical protein
MPEYTPPSGGGIDGTLSANRVSFASDSDTLTDDADFTYDATNDLLNVTKILTQVVVDVHNATGSAIPAGTPVYVTGSVTSSKPNVEPSDANNAATMPSVGIATNNIGAGSSGYIAISGLINGISTSIITDVSPAAGDILYVSTTVGELTTTKPTGTADLIQNVGRILSINGGNFRMTVNNLGRTNDVPNGLGEVVRYGLTANKGLSSGARYTFTSGDFTGYDTDTDVVTFSGTSITLKGAGTFDINLYGYFAAAANLAALGPQVINPPGDPGSTQNAVNNIQVKLDAFIENELEFDLSIGDSGASNKYAYNRNIINMGDSVVRFSQFTTASIQTTGDTVIQLSGYAVWPQATSLIATGSSDNFSGNNPQYTGFTITKVA